MHSPLASLAREIEASRSLEPELAGRTCAAIGEFLDSRPEAGDLESTDRVLMLIHRLRPGWDIAIHGTAHAPNGHWSCTLRRSAVRDNDGVIGIGHGTGLPQALLAALLKAIAYPN